MYIKKTNRLDNLILKIICFTTARLVGANNMEIGSGRVEVFYHGTWGPVCGSSYWDYNWDLKYPNIVCHQLGFPGALFSRTITTTAGRNNSDQRKQWFKTKSCKGTETSLTMCHRSGWSSHCKNNKSVHAACIPGD